jgi:AP-3 complex subunit beta
MGRGQDCRSYFAAVIKNVAFNSFAVKKLVYIYLLRYAEQEPDLALLSVNSFQKDLSDPNPMVRSVALRVLCSIRVPMLSSVMMAACKKGASDMSPFVRKAVAVSLVKTFKLDPLQKEGLIELIHQLINNEKSHIVMGSVLYSMDQICPERYNLIHKHFKRVCKLLVESDEWSQIQIIQVLARYCRIHFTDPSHCSSASLTRADESQNGIAKEPSPPPLETISHFPQLDPDYQLFIDSCKALLASRNPMLIVLASQISYDLAPGHPMRILAAKSLIRSLSRPKQEQHMILVAIKSLIIRDAKPWVGFITAFAVYPTEIEEIKALKLDILVLLSSEDSMNWIVPELKVKMQVGANSNPSCLRTTLHAMIRF